MCSKIPNIFEYIKCVLKTRSIKLITNYPTAAVVSCRARSAVEPPRPTRIARGATKSKS